MNVNQIDLSSLRKISKLVQKLFHFLFPMEQRHQQQHGIARALEEYREAEALRISSLETGTEVAPSQAAVQEAQTGQESERHLIDELDFSNELITRFSREMEEKSEFDDSDGDSQDQELSSDIPRICTDFPFSLGDHQEENEEQSRPLKGIGPLLSLLPKEVLLKALIFLDEDSLDRCKVCNRKWYMLLREAEPLWSSFCSRLFVPPAFRPMKSLMRNGISLPKKFNSWEEAKRKRPRVRMETGLYILKTMYVKATGPRTMWAPEDYKAVLEIHHFRYILFQPDGQVLYASTPLTPSQMRDKFLKKQREDWIANGVMNRILEDEGNGLAQSVAEKPRQKLTRRERAGLLRQQRRKLDPTKADTIYNGFYSVRGNDVSVVLNMMTYSVTFTLDIEANGGCYDQLVTTSHQSQYHRENEPIVTYRLSRNFFENVWYYHAFKAIS